MNPALTSGTEPDALHSQFDCSEEFASLDTVQCSDFCSSEPVPPCSTIRTKDWGSACFALGFKTPSLEDVVMSYILILLYRRSP
jgi:hypothetical protein